MRDKEKTETEESKEVIEEIEDESNQEEKQVLTWEQLRAQCRKRDLIWKSVWTLIMFLAIAYLFLIFGKNPISEGTAPRIIISAVFIIFIFFWVYVMPYLMGIERIYRESSKLFKKEVIEPVFTNAFSEAEYKGFDKSQLKEIKESGLLQKARSAIATDSVRGTYKGVDFVRYDIELSSKEKKSARVESVWITCEIKMHLKEEMQIICNDFKIGKNTYPQPEGYLKSVSKDQDFDDKFSIYIKDGKDVKDLLDSGFSKKLIKLEKENPFMISIEKGKVHIAIRRKRDSLEIPIYGKVNTEKYVREAKGEVELIQNMIEMLKEA